jgi:carboxypeptidase Taq
VSPQDQEAYDALCEFVRETALLGSCQALLGWDERTMLPPSGGEYRAKQMAYLAGAVHHRLTDPRLGEWLEQLSDGPLTEEPHSDAGATVRELKHQHQKQTRLPRKLVEELAAAEVTGQRAWAEARRANDFRTFQPQLERLVGLSREKAEAYGYDTCPYDPLLDDYEPGASTAEVRAVLEQLRADLVPLVAQLRERPRKPDTRLLTGDFPVAAQETFGRAAAEAIGFDFQAGRLDVTDHPFCSGIAPGDCRITTRYDGRHFAGAFFGILHEAGHGLYEQGLRKEMFGLPPGEFASLGIHESQSRLWENLVGRSRPFWQHFFPQAQQAFPAALGGVPLDDFHFAINMVEPSLIRVEADEATYNLHIVIRFELEQALLSGDLVVDDLPAAWNEKYEQDLGVRPPNDHEGVLQDIHWSAAMIGYFPTYTLGNLCAAQLFEKAEAEIGPLAPQFAKGEFRGLLAWLRRTIHQEGRRYSASQLIAKVTGQPLSHRPLMQYLAGKLQPLYGLT